MSGRLKSRHVVSGVMIGLLLTFQNCAAPVDESTLSSKSSFEDALPLAYEAKIDTIAYMSCSEIKTAVEPRAYFTFRAGSYSTSTGGLKLTSDFLNQTKNYSASKRADVLSSSPMNGDTRLTLSIRMAGNFQSVWANDQIEVGNEVESFLPPLDTDEISRPLAAAASGTRFNYFPGSASKRLMEASVRFLKFDNVARDTRTNLDARTALLVMGYSNSSSELDTDLRGPASTLSGNSVHGTGYFLKFALPAKFTSGERRVLASTTGSVEEMDMTTKKIKASDWKCPNNFQFMIVRAADKKAGLVDCVAGADRFDPAVPSQKEALQAIRRVLRVEDWYVDVAHKCVIPRDEVDSCYGDIGARTVQYSTTTCANTNGAGATYCPHFVSVCLNSTP